MTDSIFRPDLLLGQTAFVTGGGSGINEGIASRLAEHGASVVIVGRNQDKLDVAAARINALGKGKVQGIAADVRNMDALKNAASQTAQLFGKIDMVVAGAAGNFIAPAAQLSANGFGVVIDIDLKGTFNTFRACYDFLNTPGARCLAISAPQATQAMPAQSHACSAKAGIEMLIKTLALEWGHGGIRVNGISPGYVENTVGGDLFKGGDEGEAMKRTLPIQRFASVAEMADMALFLFTPAAGYMTGHVVALDGGAVLGPLRN